MAQHQLSLEVPDTLNVTVLPIMDTSTYSSLVPLSCPLLEITAPGFVYPAQITDPQISTGFYQAFNGCDLGLQNTNCGTSNISLPDGIYVIKYSVSPNELVYVEYNHLRITCALNKVQGIYCDIDLGACDPPTKIKDKLEKVRLIQQYLKAAKAYVEYCHQPSKGMDLYNYAVKLIDKMNCSTCKPC
jgi:hypothetical protein